eukprot:12760291-Ditylum_brightwellii.AAC.1
MSSDAKDASLEKESYKSWNSWLIYCNGSNSMICECSPPAAVDVFLVAANKQLFWVLILTIKADNEAGVPL